MNKFSSSNKESNQDWLGQIPINWDLKRVENFFDKRLEKVDDKLFPPLSVTKLGVCDQLSDVAKTNDSNNRKLVRRDDFVINSRSDRKGSSGIAKRDGSVSLINIVLIPHRIEPKYIEYLFKSYYFKEEFFRNGKGIHWDLWTTRWEQLKSIFIPIPPQLEQQKIIKYLDKKTTQINLLIKKTEKKITLLKEYKNQLINQYVTNGLDENFDKKDSLSEWIGNIPKHWELVKPKYKLNKITRSIEKSDEVITCFRDGIVTLRKNRREDGFTFSLKEHGYQQIRPGDLVIHEMDGFAGAIGISDSKGKSTPVYTVIEPDEKNDLRYIAYLLKRMANTGKIESLARSIRERTTDFRWNIWSVINFPFPPIEEQIQISNFIEKKNNQIDLLIKKYNRKIPLLKEYSEALISEVITGKVRVTEEMK
tara:strand:- start:562 stop:1824 length:1263 start_codon:yes stop_codon:yes gene_type:complete